jgi:hypothetical protein
MAVARNAAGAGLQVPVPTRRPGSASFADVYGGLDFGTTTPAAGGQGATIAGAPQTAPIGLGGVNPEFFRSPAGILVVLVGIIAIWSYVDR